MIKSLRIQLMDGEDYDWFEKKIEDLRRWLMVKEED